MQAKVTDHRPDVAVLHLKGELDANTAARLHDRLADLLERPLEQQHPTVDPDGTVPLSLRPFQVLTVRLAR